MATVPRYSDQQVAATNLPNVRISDSGVTAESFGAGIGQAVGQFARVAQGLAQQEQEKADTASLMDAQRQFSDLDASLLNDPEHGAFAQQGKNAIGLDHKVLPQWDQRASAIIDSVPARVKPKLEQYAMQRRESAGERLMSHSLTEANKYYAEEAVATTQKFQSEAITYRNDPKAVDTAADQAMQAAHVAAQRFGFGPERTEQFVRDAASTTYLGALSSLLNDDPNAAATRLASVKEFMTAKDRDAIEDKLQPYLRESDADTWLAGQLGGGTGIAGAQPFTGAAQTEAEAEAVARASVGRTIGLESGGSATAKNPNSSATGAGQFIASTWIDVLKRNRPDVVQGKSRAELLALRNDPKLSKDMAEAYAVENCKGLFKSGLPVTPETAYLCHHFGLDGARAILRADPNTPVQQVIPPKDYAANAYLHGKTVAEVVGNHAKRAGEGGAAPMPTSAPMTADGKPDFVTLKERALALPNPLQKDAALRAVERRETLFNARLQQQTAALSDAVYAAIEKAPPGQPLNRVLSPEQLTWAQKEGRVSALEGRLKQRIAGTLVQSDIVVADTLFRESATDPQTFASRNILEYADRLSTTDLEQLQARKAALLKPGSGAKPADWATDQQRIAGGLRTLKWDTLKGEDAKRKGAAFGAAYRQAKQAFIQSNDGKEPKGEQADALVRTVTQNFAADIAAGRDPAVGVRAYENMAGGAPMKSGSGQPVQLTAADRASVRSVLRARGNPNPTEAQIIAAAGAYFGAQ